MLAEATYYGHSRICQLSLQFYFTLILEPFSWQILDCRKFISHYDLKKTVTGERLDENIMGSSFQGEVSLIYFFIQIL